MSEPLKKTNRKKYYDNISVAARTTQIVHLVTKQDKASMFEQFIKNSETKQTVVIARSKRSANALSLHLEAHDIKATTIHGNHKQAQLHEAAQAFNSSKTNILITTDMIFKSLELTNIQVMVNYELPTMEDDYFVRLRYVDEIGESISFVTPEEESTLSNIEIMMKMEIPQREVKNFVPASISDDIKPTKDKKKKPRHRKVKQKAQKKSEQDSN